jgi:hypothetical protein
MTVMMMVEAATFSELIKERGLQSQNTRGTLTQVPHHI